MGRFEKDLPQGLKPTIILGGLDTGDKSPAYQPVPFKLKPALFRAIYDPVPTRVEKKAMGW